MANDATIIKLDLTGYRCPVPVLRLEAAMRNAPEVSRFMVWADDPIAAIDIPHFCRKAGHKAQTHDSERSISEGKQSQHPYFCVFEVTRGGNQSEN